MPELNTKAAARPVPRSTALVALAMALSVAAVAALPDFALAGEKEAGEKGKGGKADGGVVTITLPPCAEGDLATGAEACAGFFQGNLLSNSPADLAAQREALNAIGLSDWNGELVEPQIDLDASTVDFRTLLNGDTWIAIHFGAGRDSPSPHTPGGVTAFYRLDAGTNLDAFTTIFGSASAARLYATGPAPLPPGPLPPAGGAPFEPGGVIDDLRTAVPEPTAWTLMILGFAGAGAALRRRGALAAA